MYGPGRRWLAPNWDFMSVSLVILGICSFLFHASLRQTMEFADELSMFVLLWSMLHTTLCIRQTAARRHLISVCLAVAMLSFSAFYIWSAKIIYHVVSFFVGLFGVACRTEYLFFWAADPSFPRDMAQVWNKRALEAALISVVGYGLWTIDLEYCDVLRASRDVGLPWAWLLEFHGWWHVLTAVGADRFMTVAREVRAQTEVGKDKRKRT
jgi:dihydroceramidase